MTERRVGSEGLHVDLRPITEKRAGSLGLNVDAVLPNPAVYGRTIASVGLIVDLVPFSIGKTAQLGLMVDYVVGTVTAGIGWDGTQFVASGATPVLWGAGAFQSAGGYPSVTWTDDHFEAES